MSYIGSTPTTQSFIAGTDSFNGTGSATNFTLSRLVNSTNDIQVVVNNVVQYPPNYSVSGTTLTISPAPSAGTNNVYVRYLSTTLQSITVPGGSSVNGTFQVAQSTYLATSSGNVGVGTTSPDSLSNFKFVDVGSSGTNQGVVQANNGTVKVAIYANSTEGYLATRTNHNLSLQTNGTTRATIDTSGNVGIGTSSPSSKLHVAGGSGSTIRNTASAGSSWFVGSNVDSYILHNESNTPMIFTTNSSERARIDSSGNFILTAAGNINLNIFNTQSLAQSGYQKFPNGLIIQWGRVTFGGTSATVTFPIAFPNAFWGIAGIPKYGSAISIAFNGESTSGLTLRTSINTGDYFPYIAVGY